MKPWLSLSIIGCLLASSVLGCGGDDTALLDNPADMERTALAFGNASAEQGPAAAVIEKIGDPLWEPVDFHQMTVDASSYNDLWIFLQQFLSPPNHAWHNALGISPGAPHPPPYDDEIGEHVASLGYKEGSVFSTAESDCPNILTFLYMVVPSAGAPLGSSPDFAQGSIIPHTIFPIDVKMDYWLHGPGPAHYSHSFDVPALDTIDPGFDVEGHSHFPIFSLGCGPMPPGRHFLDYTMTDNEGNGWVIHRSYVLQQTPTP